MFNSPTRRGFSVTPRVISNSYQEKMSAPNNAYYVLTQAHAGLPNSVLFNDEFALKSTDDLTEGTTNLYFNGKTTDDLTEGTTNLYFSGKTTDDLTEGSTNLYFTDDRAKEAVKLPVGSITMYGCSKTAPDGWLFCDGSEVSRTTYADLYAIIGDTYGSGDGSTTFNLPNFNDKFARGNTAGATGGSDDAIVVSHSHTFTGNTLPTHSHTRDGRDYAWEGIDDPTNSPARGRSSGGSGTITTASAVSAGTPSGTISTEGSDGTDKNIPAFLGVSFIIKY